MKKSTVMKITAILLALLVCLGGCAVQDSTGTVTTDSQLKSVSDYFDTYEVLMNWGCENGYIYCFDDGSENGLAVAVSLKKKQMKKIDELDFFSETYEEDLANIVKTSKNFTVTALDDCLPDMSAYDKYIGQKVEVMMNDGFEETGSMISDNETALYLNDGMYDLFVIVEEVADLDQDMTTEYEKTLTVQSIEFSGWGSDFYEGLFA